MTSYSYFNGEETVRVVDASLLWDKITESLREAFKVKPYYQGGLTTMEVWMLFDHFMDTCSHTCRRKQGGSDAPQT